MPKANKKVKKVKIAKESPKAKKVAKNSKSKPIVKKVEKKMAPPKPKVKTKAESIQESKYQEASFEMTVKSESPMENKASSLSESELDNYKKWLKLQKQMADQKPHEYKMSEVFDVKTPLKHKVHGWGVVIQRRDNYIDVLFEAGLKTLIVNYKP